MAVKISNRFKGKVRDAYLELVMAFPLASVMSEDHLEQAQKVIDQLLVNGKLNYGEEMYLDALSDLVASYEDEHHPIAPASDADMLRHLMDAKGVNQARLSREAEIAKSTVSELLAGKKTFTRKIMRKLANYFSVDVSVLSANL